VYCHGRHGSPWFGDKILALRPIALKLGINFFGIDLNNFTTALAMEKEVIKVCSDNNIVPGNLILYGSSMGGYISTKASLEIEKKFNQEGVNFYKETELPERKILGIFLTAPAFYIKPDFYPVQEIKPASTRISIVHGYEDVLIPYQNSQRFAEQFGCELTLLNGGHRLNSQIPKLCELFKRFLDDCVSDSIVEFDKWLLNNPEQTVDED